MSARNKAIKGMEKSTPQWTIHCRPDCTQKHYRGDDMRWRDDPAEATAYYEPDFWHDDGDCFTLRTTRDAFRYFRLEGWTWDKSGNWLCPACSKGGEG